MMVIEPDKCIIEDLEVLSFENEEQQTYYTIWHEALVDKRREANAESERERQIIRNEIARKTRQLIGSVGTAKEDGASTKSTKTTTAATPSPAANKIPSRPVKGALSPKRNATPSSALDATRRAIAAARVVGFGRGVVRTDQAGQSATANHLRQGSMSLPNGLILLNSDQTNTVPHKQLIKYKLTKLYNKYRGRQERRNYVLGRQKAAKIAVEVNKSYLNSWLAYTALQALRLPENNINSLNATTTNSSKILTPMAQPITPIVPLAASPKKTKAGSSSSKKQSGKGSSNQSSQQTPQKAPMHLVYIDSSNIITYSNKINPQQVAEYRQKSHLLPSSATSKKSSAASYDVYEIMEVLANTNKTNVTITRNANRPYQANGTNASIYSHSVNANTPGIVSTQLHLQARSYLDSMSKFYAEESKRLAKQREEMKSEPTAEYFIQKYLPSTKLHPWITFRSQRSKAADYSRKDNQSDQLYPKSNLPDDQEEEEDELEQLENDILQMLKPVNEQESALNPPTQHKNKPIT